jgi:hypothetical protein
VPICTVADPHHVDAGSGDPACHSDADPDPVCHFVADPDPTFHFDVDPVPSLQIKGLKP